jgi:hypothetical protein
MQKFSATARQRNGKGTASVQSVFSVFVWVSVTKAMPFAFSFAEAESYALFPARLTGE